MTRSTKKESSSYEIDEEEDHGERSCCTINEDTARCISYNTLFWCCWCFFRREMPVERRRWCDCILITVVVTSALAISLPVLAIVAFGGPLRRVTITVDEASLTRFALLNTPTTTTALSYNLSLALAIRNPNLAISIEHAEPLEAAFRFDGQQFDRVQVADKGGKIGNRKTVEYRLAASSDSASSAALGNAGEMEFVKQNVTGVFEVEVVLTGRFKYTLRRVKCSLDASCPLKLQLLSPGTPAPLFQKLKCNVVKPKSRYC